mgnify:CR=1 FL=1
MSTTSVGVVRRTLVRTGSLALAAGLVYMLHQRLRDLQLEVSALNGSVQGQRELILELLQRFGTESSSTDTLTPEEAIAEADRLYEAGQTLAAHQLLSSRDNRRDAEALWRLARLCQELSDAQLIQERVGKARDSARARELLLEGFDFSAAALALSPDHFATHKWYGIMLSVTAGFGGTKAAIQQACAIHAYIDHTYPSLLTTFFWLL